MNAMKVEKDNPKAIRLFREALALNPNHEDSRYYLGLCLASQGRHRRCARQLAELKRINPQSHRAWQQWGVLRAIFANHRADLAAAEEIACNAPTPSTPKKLARFSCSAKSRCCAATTKSADERPRRRHRTNPKAVGGFFLRGYLAWKRGDDAAAKFLEETRTAPRRLAAQRRDQRRRRETKSSTSRTTPLTRFWESWDAVAETGRSFATLDSFLNGRRP